MKVDVIFTAGAIDRAELAGRTAVVFDVLRATSTIVTALANGCRAVVPVVDVEAARRTAEELAAAGDAGGGVLLGGERGGARLPGFPHGNSPLEYGPEVAADKILVLTTTNGTRAIHGALPAAEIYAGSLLNARAAAAAALAAGRDVSLICAGTQERFSLEDTAAAGFVLAEMFALAEETAPDRPGGEKKGGTRPEPTDAAVAALHLAAAYRRNPLQIMYDSRHGQKLLRLGQAADLVHCAQLNALPVLPVYRDGRLVRAR